MRCKTCGRKMVLVQVVPDHTKKMVPGFEQQIFRCLAGHGTHQRLVFSQLIERAVSEPIILARSSSDYSLRQTGARLLGSLWHRIVCRFSQRSDVFGKYSAAVRLRNTVKMNALSGPFVPDVPASAGVDQRNPQDITPAQVEETIFLLERLSKFSTRRSFLGPRTPTTGLSIQRDRRRVEVAALPTRVIRPAARSGVLLSSRDDHGNARDIALDQFRPSLFR
jgi:hypothetical protein